MQNGKILVVDEESEIVLQLSTVLKNEGWDVIEAANGSDALREMLSEMPWLIVLGEFLPDMPGHQLLETLAQQMNDFPNGTRPQIVMVFRRGAPLEGMNRYSEFPRGREIVDTFLGRPFEPQELALVVSYLRADAEANGLNNGLRPRWRTTKVKTGEQ